MSEYIKWLENQIEARHKEWEDAKDSGNTILTQDIALALQVYGKCLGAAREDPLLTRAPLMQDALDGVEFVSRCDPDSGVTFMECPWCGGSVGDHAPNCLRQRALGLEVLDGR